MNTNHLLIVFLGVLLVGGCASIPKESPELSQEVGRRVAAMQEAHLRLVDKYFELKQAEINKIFEEEWIPAYAESFFAQPDVSNYWEKLVTGDDPEERLQFLTRLGPRMLEEIRQRRAEYMAPLNKLETQVKDSLRREYRQILSANNTLTSFLANSSKVAQNRERYLELFGIEQTDIESYVEQADKRSEEIMETIENANLD